MAVFGATFQDEFLGGAPTIDMSDPKKYFNNLSLGKSMRKKGPLGWVGCYIGDDYTTQLYICRDYFINHERGITIFTSQDLMECRSRVCFTLLTWKKSMGEVVVY